MEELDEVWSEMLSLARANAEASGRSDVAAYLALKAANDSLRQTGVKWLFDSFTELATLANLANSAVKIESTNPHNFPFKGANIVGSALRVRYGVRCLTLEAGWTRTPKDGFMRGGALAIAKISHFGMASSNMDLMLARPFESPEWFAIVDDDNRVSFHSDDIRDHFRIFLGV